MTRFLSYAVAIKAVAFARKICLFGLPKIDRYADELLGFRLVLLGKVVGKGRFSTIGAQIVGVNWIEYPKVLLIARAIITQAMYRKPGSCDGDFPINQTFPQDHSLSEHSSHKCAAMLRY